MLSALDSQSGGLHFSSDGTIVLCSWEKHFTLTVTLITQEYKWVLVSYWSNLTEG